MTELGVKVSPQKDIIVVDGKKLSLPDSKNTFWVALNKPKSVITTMEDDKDRETIISLVPKAKELRLVPVGRLERDATGILLLTNEVGWIHPLTHLSFENFKKYEIVVQGMPTEADLDRLRDGIVLEVKGWNGYEKMLLFCMCRSYVCYVHACLSFIFP